MADPIEVTDEDRRAAGEAYAELTGLAVQPDDLRGDWLVRRFAAHRLAAEARGAESERARVVEWLNAREGAWRRWSWEWQGIGAAHMPRVLGEAIERGDHYAHHADQGEGL